MPERNFRMFSPSECHKKVCSPNEMENLFRILCPYQKTVARTHLLYVRMTASPDWSDAPRIRCQNQNIQKWPFWPIMCEYKRRCFLSGSFFLGKKRCEINFVPKKTRTFGVSVCTFPFGQKTQFLRLVPLQTRSCNLGSKLSEFGS